MPKQQIRVDVNSLRIISCPLCKHEHFIAVSRLRIVPPLISQTGKTDLISEVLYQCTYYNCVHEIPALLKQAIINKSEDVS